MAGKKLEDWNEKTRLLVTAQATLAEEEAQYVLFIPDGNGGHESVAFKDDEALDAYLESHPELKDNKGLFLATQDEKNKVTVTPFDANPEEAEGKETAIIGDDEKEGEKTREEIAKALDIKTLSFDEVLAQRREELAALEKQLQYTTGGQEREALEAAIDKKQLHIAKMEKYAEDHPEEVADNKNNGLFIEMAAEKEVSDFEAHNYMDAKDKKYAENLKELIANAKKGNGKQEDGEIAVGNREKDLAPDQGEEVTLTRGRLDTGDKDLAGLVKDVKLSRVDQAADHEVALQGDLPNLKGGKITLT